MNGLFGGVLKMGYEPGSHINVVAVRHDISVSLLHGWRHQVRHGLLRSEGGATGFVPVRVVAAQRAGSCYPAPSSAIEVALPDGSRLYIQDGANAATLRHIIAALRS